MSLGAATAESVSERGQGPVQVGRLFLVDRRELEELQVERAVGRAMRPAVP